MNLAEIKKSLPQNLVKAVPDYIWQQNHTGFSGMMVFHLQAKNEKALYLKIDPHASKSSLSREKQKLDWLRNQLPVPETLIYAEDENHSYLLLSEIPGAPATDDSLKTDLLHVIEESVNGLKMIHDLPIENCPFNERLTRKIENARERMLKGLVDEEDFDDQRRGRTAEDLFGELIATQPTDEDLVFTHGDYCAPNIILDNEKLSGFVDWANAGVADRYQDLALLTRSVRYNFGEEWEKSVFEIYGVEPDWNKIRFYRLLDEFF